MNTEKLLKLSIALFVGFLFFFILPKSASAQCAGFTRCGSSLPEGGCDPDHDYIIGCGNGCSSGGCGGCEISSSCNGGPAPVCKCGTRVDGSCKPCSGGNQCNTDYIRNCISGTKTEQLTGENFCVGPGACKDGSGNIIVGSAQSLGGCCSEKCEPNPPYEDECWCNGTTVTTYTCCPAGTVNSCHTEPVTYWKETCQAWSNPCGSDTFVQWGAVTGGRCAPRDENGNPQTWINVQCQGTQQVCECVACDATAPSGVNFNSSSSNLTWNIGTNGTSQRLYISKTQSDTTNNCGVGTSCTVNANLNSSTNLYPLAGLLDPLTIYYTKIVTYKDDTCSSSTNYSFTTPVANNPWWQVKDGDATTNGNLTSRVPSGNVFLTNGLGGFPGVAIYSGTFNLSSTQNLISSTSWNANTSSSQSRLFNYNYFAGLIPDDVVINNIANLATGGSNYIDGYEWFKINGNLDINSSIDFGDRKVILFVENGDLNINSNLNLNDGIGFFGAFVDGSINVNSSVTGTPALEGMYMADSNFQTGTTGAGDTRLHIRGSVATHGNFLLQRDLTDNSTSAELFEYAPDQILLFPDKLAFKQTRWAEVAP